MVQLLIGGAVALLLKGLDDKGKFDKIRKTVGLHPKVDRILEWQDMYWLDEKGELIFLTWRMDKKGKIIFYPQGDKAEHNEAYFTQVKMILRRQGGIVTMQKFYP